MKERKKIFPFHPFCIALYPVISLYSHNLALFPAFDLFRPCAIVLAVTTALYALLFLVFRNFERAAFVTSVTLILFFSFSVVAGVIHSILPSWVLVPLPQGSTGVWFVLAGIVIILAAWKWKKSLAAVSGFLNVASGILLLLPVVSTIYGLIHIESDLAQLSTVKSTVSAVARKDLPDIYYVILDGYGREDALQRYFGYSNKPFVKSLQDRGFFVADQSRSNYCQTELSLASSLNMDFTSKLVPNPSDNFSRAPLDRLLDRSAVSAFLKQHGYEYVAVTSGFPGVEPHSADLLITNQSRYSLFEATLLGTTPFQASRSAVGSMYDSRRDDLLSALGNLQSMEPRGIKPRFVFAHILAPHPPFVIDGNGDYVRPKHTIFGYWDASAFFAVGGTKDEYQRGYIGQLEYVNTRILQIVDHLVKLSSTPPIIILQGDHGSREYLDQNSLARSDVREAFRNFNAFLVPSQVRKNLYASITPVNSFRMVLDGLFGMNYPRMPDISYYSTWDHPFDDIDVTQKVLKPLYP
jgi:hypothetical protein